jgi:hypothetical protein
MNTSLPNTYKREKEKTMTRERSLTKSIRKIRNTLRRSLMVKLILTKNEIQVMGVSSQKVMKQQP